MKIIYQGEPGAYTHIATEIFARKNMISPENIVAFPTFESVWRAIGTDTIAVLPIENSYMGSIHENLYAFLRYGVTIIAETSLDIHHMLLSYETDIARVRRAYSFPPALSQCYEFLRWHGIEPVAHSDTAAAARYLSETRESGAAVIASERAGEIYDVPIMMRNIEDQNGNTTRFLVVATPDTVLESVEKTGKISILFEAADVPAALYKCLGAFATHDINLTKIESLPSRRDPFTYLFWLDFSGASTDARVRSAMDELRFFTKNITILGEY